MELDGLRLPDIPALQNEYGVDVSAFRPWPSRRISKDAIQEEAFLSLPLPLNPVNRSSWPRWLVSGEAAERFVTNGYGCWPRSA